MELGRKATLYDGVCEQASCILQRMLSEEGVDTQMKYGEPFAGNHNVHAELQGMPHYVLDLGGLATIDATYGQFLRRGGVDLDDPALSDRLPAQRIALIPAGQERYFGQRFVAYADNLRKQQLRDVFSQEVPDSVLASVWLPEHYTMLSDVV